MLRSILSMKTALKRLREAIQRSWLSLSIAAALIAVSGCGNKDTSQVDTNQAPPKFYCSLYSRLLMKITLKQVCAILLGGTSLLHPLQSQAQQPAFLSDGLVAYTHLTVTTKIAGK